MIADQFSWRCLRPPPPRVRAGASVAGRSMVRRAVSAQTCRAPSWCSRSLSAKRRDRASAVPCEAGQRCGALRRATAIGHTTVGCRLMWPAARLMTVPWAPRPRSSQRPATRRGVDADQRRPRRPASRRCLICVMNGRALAP